MITSVSGSSTFMTQIDLLYEEALFQKRGFPKSLLR